MEKLVRALSVIQQGMLRNNPGHVKDSVSEATELLSCCNPGEAGISPRLEKVGNTSETALCVSGRYPKKADKGGEEGCAFSP